MLLIIITIFESVLFRDVRCLHQAIITSEKGSKDSRGGQGSGGKSTTGQKQQLSSRRRGNRQRKKKSSSEKGGHYWRRNRKKSDSSNHSKMSEKPGTKSKPDEMKEVRVSSSPKTITTASEGAFLDDFQQWYNALTKDEKCRAIAIHDASLIDTLIHFHSLSKSKIDSDSNQSLHLVGQERNLESSGSTDGEFSRFVIISARK